MNVHAGIDRLSIRWTARRLGRVRFFDRSLDSPTYADHLAAVEMRLPERIGPGLYAIRARSAVGPVVPAVRLPARLDPDRPVVIYHHANGEVPFDRSFRWIFRRACRDVNCLLIRAAFYRSWDEYVDAIRDLARQMALLMVSVRLMEELVRFLKAQGCTHVTITGLSLGGFVANLHHTFFGSADAYRPLLAGTALGEVFVASAYRRLVASTAREAAPYLRERLNFDRAFRATDRTRVAPLLARYDQVVRYPDQARAYPEENVRVLNRGHITGALSFRHLLDHVRGSCIRH